MLDAVALLKQAVAIPSPSGQEAEVAAFLVGEMARFCAEGFVDASGSAVGRWGAGPLLVYVLGHIDTVPGRIPVRVEDGRLYGRGAVDAKGPFCAAVAAVSRLDAGLKDRLNVRLIGATEEEAPSSRGARHALRAYPPPDVVVIAEPSGWEALTLGYKGRLAVSVQCRQAQFHSAGEGVAAAERVVEVWNDLKAQAEAYNQNARGLFDSLQISLQDVNSHNDGLTQTATATIGYRLPLALTPDALEASVRELVAGRLELEAQGGVRAYRAERDTPLSRAFRQAIRAAGGRPRFTLKTGTSDMNVVAPVWDVPMLAYGAGDSALDHSPDEHVILEDYGKAVAVLATALETLAER